MPFEGEIAPITDTQAARPRQAGPPVKAVGPGGYTVWYVSRNADIRSVLSCPFASSNPSNPGFPEPEDLTRRTPFLIELDDPRHGELRRLVRPEFGSRSVDSLRPRLRASAERLTADMLAAGPEANFSEAFAKPMASQAICHLLAVPLADGPELTRIAETLGDDTCEADAQSAAMAAVTAYMEQLIEERIARPGADLFGRLTAGPLKEGGITHAELVALAILLLMAGHDTNAKMLVLGVGTLLDHPDAQARIVADEAAAFDAVDELVRLHSIADDDGFRAATADIAVGGIVIPAGEGIVPLTRHANHDPAVFDRPGDFRLDRDTKLHLGFGYGPHHCLGRPLARAVQAISYRTLFGAIPGMVRATQGDPLIVTGW